MSDVMGCDLRQLHSKGSSRLRERRPREILPLNLAQNGQSSTLTRRPPPRPGTNRSHSATNRRSLPSFCAYRHKPLDLVSTLARFSSPNSLVYCRLQCCYLPSSHLFSHSTTADCLYCCLFLSRSLHNTSLFPHPFHILGSPHPWLTTRNVISLLYSN